MSESLWRKVRPFLTPFTGIYALGINLRNLAYDRNILKIHKLPIPVISIGNVTVGGTGKTPVTLSLARLLQDPPYNQKPAVLSRGYKRKSRGYQLVSAGDGPICDAIQSGDEPQMYARKLSDVPVAVDTDRVRGGRTLIRHLSPSVILLDDAFQHRRLHRDLDIVLLDSSVEFQQERLLPAGPMREPMTSLKRADLIVLTHFQPGDDVSEQLWDICAEQFGEDRLCACGIKPVRCTRINNGKEIPLDELRKCRLIAFCGIAKPETYLQALIKLGTNTPFLIRFPDHHRYRPKDVEKLANVFTAEKADYLITTEKDAVKLSGLFQALPILALEIEIDWLNGTENLKRELFRLFE